MPHIRHHDGIRTHYRVLLYRCQGLKELVEAIAGLCGESLDEDMTRLWSYCFANRGFQLVNKLNSGAAEVVVKVEYFNPGGSVKDRIALAMIEAAE